MEFIVNFLLLTCVGYAVAISEDTVAYQGMNNTAGLCCPEGQVLQRKDGYDYCWDSTSNSTTFIDFTCDGIRTRVYTVYNRVNEDGQLEILLKHRIVIHQPNTFCLGYRAITNNTTTSIAVVCHERPPGKHIHEEVYGYAMVISAAFLIATAIIYATQRKLRNPIGLSVINFCGALGIGLGLVSVMTLMPYTDMDLCAARGFFSYFFMVASFFWANVLSIQIYIHLRNFYSVTIIDSDPKLFVWYIYSYAWGCPAVLTLIMAIVNFIPGDHLKPGIGLNHCWFFDMKQQWIYMYSVLTIILVANVFLFKYCAILLWNDQRDIITISDKVLITMRLFIVMGLPWIFELISSIAPRNLFCEVLDLTNTLQGVVIFIVLVVPPFSDWTFWTKKNKIIHHHHRHTHIDRRYNKFVL